MTWNMYPWTRPLAAQLPRKAAHWLSTLLVLLALPWQGAMAQTISTTNPPYNGGNGVSGNGVITFGVQNNSGGDVLLTDLSSYWQVASNGANITLWASTISLGGPYFPFNAPDWTVVGTTSNLAVPSEGIHPTITGMTYLIPNGASVRFLLESNNAIRYSGTGVLTPNSFTVGGISLRCGDFQMVSGQNVGYGGLFSNSGNNPRYFTGSVTFVPATPCAGQPTAGTVSGPPFVCSGGSASLTLNGSSQGTGITREWYSSLSSGGPYSTFVGSGTSVSTGPVTSTTYYVCVVTCTNSSLSAQTAEFPLNVQGAGAGGTFTINNTLPTGGSNFNNFTDAINYLNLLSACGPFTGAYTINVSAGQTFNEDPPALTASGSPGNPITFQRSGVGANPLLTPTGTAGTTDFGFGIRGGNWITVNGVDIQGSSAVEYGYYIANASATVSSNNNTIKNCTIRLDRNNVNSRGILVTSSTVGGGFTPTAVSGSNSNNALYNFTIENCNAGIFVTSGATGFPGIGNIVGTEAGGTSVVGADFLGLPTPDIGGGTAATWGIQFNNQTDGQIFNVTVRNIASSGGINRGIYSLGATGNTRIHGNRIYGVRNTSTTSTSGQRGIEVTMSTTGTHTTRVYNNFVSNITAAYTTATTTRIVTGIYVTNGAAGMTWEVDHNNVSIDNVGSPAYSTVCLDFISATSVNRARGNTLANFTGPQTGTPVHFAIRTAGTTTFGAAGSVSNYNNLYLSSTSNGFIGQTSATNQALISNWTSALSGTPGTDANSISADPLYVDNNSDLHVTGPDNNGAGPPSGLAWITVDIDGDPRGTPPDIGADEYVPATCFPPTNVTLAALTATTADFTWTSTGALDYDWEVRTSGAPGSGPAGLFSSGNVAGSPLNLTGLNSQTTYALYVRSNCTGPIASAWSGAEVFTTPCLPISSLPWTDSFEAATVNNGDPLICYSKEIITGSATTTWRTQVAPIRNGIGARTGTDYMVHNWSANSWLFSPGIQLTGGQTYEFSFWYVHTDAVAGHTLNAGVGTAPSGASMTPLGSIVDVVNTTYVKAAYLYTAPSTGVYYFGLQDVSTTSSPWYICTDDWRVGDPPSCPTPANFANTGATATTASFSWNCVACTGPYYIEYGAPGFTPGTGASPGVGGTMAGPFAGLTGTITGLTNNTPYSAVIRQDCAGQWSLNSGTVSFTTPALVSTFPYCEDFETANLCLPSACNTATACTATAFGPTGWTQATNDQGEWSVDNGGTSSTLTGPVTGATTGQPDYFPGTITGKYVYLESSSPCFNQEAIALSPAFDVSGFTNPNVRAKMAYHMYGQSMGTMWVEVEDPAGSNNWTTLWSNSTDQGPTPWQLTPDLDHVYTGPQIRYRVRGLAGPNFYSDMAFDYFCVSEGPSCLPPTATLTVVPDCGNSRFFVDVDVTSLGDATSIGISSNVNGIEIPTITTTGVVQVGPYNAPFPLGGSVTLTLIHNQDPVCNTVLAPVTYTCPVIAPICETFDLYPISSCGVCNTNNVGITQGGWSNGTVGRQWQTCNANTTSTNTGPTGIGDHTSGTGNYVYTEGTTCTGTGEHILISPAVNLSALTQPNLNFWYHMYGATVPSQTIFVDMEDPAFSNNWVPVTTLTESTPGGVNAWQFKANNLNPVNSTIRVRWRTDIGTTFDADMALDDICISEAPNCTSPVATYTVVNNCADQTFTVNVDLISLGNSSTVNLVSNRLGTEHTNISAPGQFVMGPYCLLPGNVTITVRHNDQPAFCSISSPVLSTTCPYPYCFSTTTGPSSLLNSQVTAVTLLGATQDILFSGNCPAAQLGVQAVCGERADMYAGLPYSITVNFGTCASLLAGRGEVWIDFNKNGVFEPGESIGQAVPGSPPGIQTFNFVVPPTATLGKTGMRVMLQQGATVYPLDPCATFANGSRVDFVVEILPNPGCTPPAASVTGVIPNCATFSYSIGVNLTSLGSASSVNLAYSLNGGPYQTAQANITTPGTYTITGIPASAITNVRVVHNQNNLCNLNVGNFQLSGVQCVDCGGPAVQTTYCYGPSENRTWSYSTNGGGTLKLKFNRGTIESQTWDNLVIYDGPDDTYPILFSTLIQASGTCNLGPPGSAILNTTNCFHGVDVTATGNSLFMRLTTDPSVQCASSATYDPWDWEVLCLNCTAGAATGTVVENCGGGQYSVNVNVTSLGSQPTLDLAASVNNGPYNVLQTVNATGVYTVGPFNSNAAVALRLVNNFNNLCNFQIGTFSSCCSGSCITAVPAVIGTNFCPPINCGGNATNAGGAGATNARFFTFTAPSVGTLSISSCGAVNNTNPDTRLTLHSGTCGNLTLAGFSDDVCAYALGGSAFASQLSKAMGAGESILIEWDDRWDGTAFNWTLGFVPCTPNPAADLCSNQNPAANPLNIGGTVTFTGVRDCLTKDAIIPNPYSPTIDGWGWAAFQLLTCADVTIDYCGSATWGTASLNMYGDCGQTFINSQAYNFGTGATCPGGQITIFFTNLAPGVYYYPVLWSLTSNAVGPYTIQAKAFTPTVPCAPNTTCAGAIPLTCNSSVTGSTANQLPTLPANACPYPNSPNSGGSLWYSYTPTVDETVILSTCGSTSYNTRLSVFTGSGCGNLSCYTLGDDKGGACGNRTQIEFYGQQGVTYYIAVHGPTGFDNGSFTLNVGCAAACAPPSNDRCSTAQVLPTYLNNGSAVPTVADNSCAMNDAWTSCSPVLSNQGLWYTFNTGPNSLFILNLLTNEQDATLTSSTMSYALFSGSCNGGLQAVGEEVCQTDGDGEDVIITGLTPNTNYYLYVWNPGDVGFEGTFSIQLEHPAVNDAGITEVIGPDGLLCTSLIEPVVELTNFGEATLTSVQILYDLNGGTPLVYNWTGSLPFGQSTTVSLPSFTSGFGLQTLNVTVANPNGQVDENPSNNSSSSQPNVTGEQVVVEITSDDEPSGLYWEIINLSTFVSVANSIDDGPVYAPNSTQTATLCLSVLNGNRFSFTLFDFLGDGLSGTGNGNGSWKLRTTSNRILIQDDFDGTIDGIATPTFSPLSPAYVNGHEFALPPGPASIMPEECGVFINSLQSKVYCQTVPGAIQYQFEFLDPDRGFIRRIAKTTNWVAFGEMITNPLVPGRKYFARVRVNTGAGLAAADWGTGCEMGVDPGQVPGCTGLINNPLLSTNSCGVTKTFGGSAKIWANPVYGATQYRFRFEGLIDPDGPLGPNPPAGGTRILTQASYVLVLNWATFTLVPGQTYSVTVEVLVAGQWSGYCGPTCGLTIALPPAANAGQREVDATAHSGMQLWPNPVRDGQVNLLIDGLTDEMQRITVDVYDLFGKRVMSRDMENSGPVFNTILELDGLATGLYMVNVTVNDTLYQQRVSVM